MFMSWKHKTFADSNLEKLFIFDIICEMIHTGEIEPNRISLEYVEMFVYLTF